MLILDLTVKGLKAIKSILRERFSLNLEHRAQSMEALVFFKVRPHIPFSALNTVWRSLDKQAENILDVGCGKGEPMTFIKR